MPCNGPEVVMLLGDFAGGRRKIILSHGYREGNSRDQAKFLAELDGLGAATGA